MSAVCASKYRGKLPFPRGRGLGKSSPRAGPGSLSLALALFFANLGAAQDHTPPELVFNPISVRLDAGGRHTLTPSEINRLAAGSHDVSGITLLLKSA